VGFGDTFTSLWTNTKPYNDSTMKEASAYVAKMAADMGGTEILPAIRSILNVPLPSDQPYPRQVFLLTDGQVSNTTEILKYVRTKVAECRIFTLGIGSSVSRHLVKSIARATNGQSEFITQNDEIATKCMRQLQNALQPSLSRVKVLWEASGLLQEGENSKQIEQSPVIAPPIFASTRFFMYGFNVNAKNIIEGKSPVVFIQAHSNRDVEGSDEVKISIPLRKDCVRYVGESSDSSTSSSTEDIKGTEDIKVENKSTSSNKNVMIHKLGARARIRELEEELLMNKDEKEKKRH